METLPSVSELVNSLPKDFLPGEWGYKRSEEPRTQVTGGNYGPNCQLLYIEQRTEFTYQGETIINKDDPGDGVSIEICQITGYHSDSDDEDRIECEGHIIEYWVYLGWKEDPGVSTDPQEAINLLREQLIANI